MEKAKPEWRERAGEEVPRPLSVLITSSTEARGGKKGGPSGGKNSLPLGHRLLALRGRSLARISALNL